MCNWMPTCCREAAHKDTEIKRLRAQRDKAVEALRMIADALDEAMPNEYEDIIFVMRDIARDVVAEIVEKNDD